MPEWDGAHVAAHSRVWLRIMKVRSLPGSELHCKAQPETTEGAPVEQDALHLKGFSNR